jgi:hypothetical protein
MINLDAYTSFALEAQADRRQYHLDFITMLFDDRAIDAPHQASWCDVFVTGGLTKARLDRRDWDRGDRATGCRLSVGLTASGQNITLSLRKSCAPLVAAMEGRKGMPPETTSRRFPPPWTVLTTFHVIS